ncbi:hypothetical protein [Sphingomonas phyllosphaerae]|uniref:hypothetical protein n=1 Tax=Sphingomonas phyllosphaerae TaxID=257003 RepID=UPI0024130A24|nr:hypothetical protein [Sphingomonas phyllosphaerae]
MGLQLVITDAGRAAVLDQAGGGFRAVRVAAVGLSPTALRATPTAAALAGETKRVATIAGEATAADTIHLTVTDETADAYAVRAFALYLADGTLFALYGQDEVIVEKSPQALLLLALDVALVDVPAMAITFGSAAFTNPAATTKRAGVVTLATPDEARAGADRVRALTPATARGAVLDWLGFTPVQQGTGLGQRANVVKIGWSGVRLLVTVDATDQGAVVFERGGDTVWRLDNDGAGSGLDADLLDGRDGADYLADRGRVAAANLDTAVANGCYAIEYPGYQDSLLAWRTASSTGTMQLAFGYTGQARWRSWINNKHWSEWRTLWHSGNDGAGSGLDADLFDGRDNTDFLADRGRLDAANLDEAVANGFYRLEYDGYQDSLLAWRTESSTGLMQLAFGYTGRARWRSRIDNNHWSDWRTFWHSDNDGAGSGLDADLFDGRDNTDFLADRGRIDAASLDDAVANGFYRLEYDGYQDSLLAWRTVSSTGTMQLAFGYSGRARWRSRIDNNRWSDWRTFWHSDNDGAGSGLDADLLDGRDNTDFLADRGRIDAASLDDAVANGFYRVEYDGYQDSLLAWRTASSTGTMQLAFGYSGRARWRSRIDNNRWSE